MPERNRSSAALALASESPAVASLGLFAELEAIGAALEAVAASLGMPLWIGSGPGEGAALTEIAAALAETAAALAETAAADPVAPPDRLALIK